ncbi:hypothetical protein LUZ60_017055 [Juncus effusus]|nr:hypothetical protein LUZ60_017055 [Juncus effusus]
MGLKKNLINPILFLLLACAAGAQNFSSSLYNVMDYGAAADGHTDSTQEFQQTWEKACVTDGNPIFSVPEGSYLVGPLIFKGPCKSYITIQLKGKLLASTDLSKYTANWIEFQYLTGLTINGGGVFDGQGASAWPQDMCPKSSKCKNLPMSLVFSFVENAWISDIHMLNSKSFHLNFFASNNIHLHALNISAPSDSPNTDGIHMGDCSNINITDTTIGTGDDCISIGSGSMNVTVRNVNCGPGHGISIGSLGKSTNEKDVRNLTIKNCTLTDTQNGVRAPSKVKVEHVTFKNINGTLASPEAIKLVCSDAVPCEGIELSNINLECNNGGAMNATCVNVQGTLDGSINPSSCTMMNSQ